MTSAFERWKTPQMARPDGWATWLGCSQEEARLGSLWRGLGAQAPGSKAKITGVNATPS